MTRATCDGLSVALGLVVAVVGMATGASVGISVAGFLEGLSVAGIFGSFEGLAVVGTFVSTREGDDETGDKVGASVGELVMQVVETEVVKLSSFGAKEAGHEKVR